MIGLFFFLPVAAALVGLAVGIGSALAVTADGSDPTGTPSATPATPATPTASATSVAAPASPAGTTTPAGPEQPTGRVARVLSSRSEKPRMSLKSVRPLFPPKPMSLRKKASSRA